MFSIDAVRADIAERLFLEPQEVSDTANLFDEGLDSVGLLGLVEQWREQGAQVSFADLAERPTLRAWWDVLSSA
ncbi:phosphopantetheine-binding protein [Amycolatopsis sp. NPDC059657]|uniref:phosphopantetheine-binding protein n=1 Tax=Amycolatopsis sp. NPDC059657 TaxID=3346899 RepID=UPI00367280C1